jgi:hypothetical protein
VVLGGQLAVMMEVSTPATDGFKFKIEEVLDDQSIDWNLPFPDMDKVDLFSPSQNIQSLHSLFFFFIQILSSCRPSLARVRCLSREFVHARTHASTHACADFSFWPFTHLQA